MNNVATFTGVLNAPLDTRGFVVWCAFLVAIVAAGEYARRWGGG